MKRSINIEPSAFADLVDMGKKDTKLLSKTMRIIQECIRSPFDGIGKPEPQKHNLKGYWSRRVNDEHRLIYKVEDERITIISCRDHY